LPPICAGTQAACGINPDHTDKVILLFSGEWALQNIAELPAIDKQSRKISLRFAATGAGRNEGGGAGTCDRAFRQTLPQH
jgi:hypothetical protein